MTERDWLIGRVLGKYRLEKQIGAGAFASIYEAVHIHLHVPFAIKILHPAFANEEEVLRRFFREARAASQLQHENVVFIADFDVEEGVGPYIVMEYLEGDTLKKFLSQRVQPPLELVGEIARQICLALGQAHRKNIVHRDLKPENIFLVQREMGRVLVKILDFGIAHLGKLTDSITGSRLIGTPVYMAPEQFRGVAHSPSIDIYSFGVILYEMLTGQTPFIGHNVQQLGIEHLLMPAPELPENFPAGLRQLQARLLGKTPEERPSSMEEVWMLMAPALDPEGRFPHWHRQDQHIFTGALMPGVLSADSINYPSVDQTPRTAMPPPSVTDTHDHSSRSSVNDTHDGPEQQLPDAISFHDDIRPTAIGPLPSGSASDLLASLRPLEDEEDIFEGAETMVGPVRNPLLEGAKSGQVYQTLRMPSYNDEDELVPDHPTDINLPVFGGAAGEDDVSLVNALESPSKGGSDFFQGDTKDEMAAPLHGRGPQEREQALSAEDLVEELGEQDSLLGQSSLLDQADSFSLEEGGLVIDESKPPPSPPRIGASQEEQELDLVIHDMGDQLWDEHEESAGPELAIKRAPQMVGSADDIDQVTEISTAPKNGPSEVDEDSLQITEISMSSDHGFDGFGQPVAAVALSGGMGSSMTSRVSSDFSQLSTVRTRNPMTVAGDRDTMGDQDVLSKPGRNIPQPKTPPPILGGAAALRHDGGWSRERFPAPLRPIWDMYQRMSPLERRLLMMVWVGAILVVASVLWLLWPEVSTKSKVPSPRAGIVKQGEEIEIRLLSGSINAEPINVYDEGGRYLGKTPMSVRGRSQKVVRYRLEPSGRGRGRYRTTFRDILFDPNKAQITLELDPR
ncbi:MAG: serine/threonine protein kinase [Myxococcales bacterium]|nr:serine/threonine protein kinase [Myxococcales bacterium]MCB9644325.1 serine/threonine protein kinase [Myxococcales bacterium]